MFSHVAARVPPHRPNVQIIVRAPQILGWNMHILMWTRNVSNVCSRVSRRGCHRTVPKGTKYRAFWGRRHVATRVPPHRPNVQIIVRVPQILGWNRHILMSTRNVSNMCFRTSRRGCHRTVQTDKISCVLRPTA